MSLHAILPARESDTFGQLMNLAVDGEAICSNSERGVDEGRTKSLKAALERIWKNLDPHSQIFKRYPFEPGAPVVPILPRGRNRRRFLESSTE